jgi:NTE family protein
MYNSSGGIMEFRIGVALSSGGAAGLAHIGVLEELTSAGVDVQCVAGTSAGSMVGAAYAAGRLDEFRDRMVAWHRRRRLALFDPIWPRSGLLGGRRAIALLGSCASESIENLPRRFAAVATDLDTGQRVTLRAGELGDAIRASIAIPGVLAPICRGGRLLVDGALTDPVPVGPAREIGATFVIASSVIGSAGTALTTRRFCEPPTESLRGRVARLFGHSRSAVRTATSLPLCDGTETSDPAAARDEGLATILFKASAVVQTTIAAARLRDEAPDFLIAPAAYDIGLFDVHRAAEAIEVGRAATRAALPELLAAIEHAQSIARSSSRWWTSQESEDQTAAA